MTYLSELLSQVFGNLFRNKLRSILTMSGIAWGVASIVLIVAMGDGFKEGQRNNTKQIGENIAMIFGGRTEKQAGGQRTGRRIRLDFKDVVAIREECYLVTRVTGELQTNARAVSEFNSGSFTVNGVEAMYPQLRTIPIGEGRFFNEAEAVDARRVCVLGDTVRQQLFGDRKGVLGSEVRLNGLPYRIVGLMPVKTQNGSYNGLDGEKIYVPYETLARDMPPIDPNFVPGRVANLIYSPASVTQWKEARKQVMVVLGRNHGFEPDDTGAISTFDTVENAEMIDGIFDSMTVFLGIIAMVTLTLGGVGVMNIMLVSVTERTQEIGLRKALGATRRRILMDFIVEGIVLVLISGFFGWGFAYGLSWLVSFAPKIDYFSGLPVDNTTTAIAFGALAVVALLSTIIPASRAASLTPVEALRHER